MKGTQVKINADGIIYMSFIVHQALFKMIHSEEGSADYLHLMDEKAGTETEFSMNTQLTELKSDSILFS